MINPSLFLILNKNYMGFKKQNIVNEFDIEINVPEVFGGGQIVLPVKITTTEESTAARAKFLALETEDRTGEELTQMAREYICGLLTKEPVGIDDFPKDGRSLYERAVDYFSSGDEQQQQFFDRMLFQAYLSHGDQSNPKVFFRSSAVDSKGSGADAGVS